eukprot:2315652-Pleurochrysis_carterae.AAC.1
MAVVVMTMAVMATVVVAMAMVATAAVATAAANVRQWLSTQPRGRAELVTTKAVMVRDGRGSCRDTWLRVLKRDS